MLRTSLPWLIAALVVLADRVTKVAVLRNLAPGSWVDVVPGFALTHVHNPGIAFSLFSDGGPLSRLVLHMVIVVAIVVIVWMVVRHGHHHPAAGLAFGLILGGALGNLIDRVLWGWVLDFIHLWVRVGDRVWSWPDFNIADSAITVGAGVLIVSEIVSGRKDGQRDASDPD
jgi:signal peptidase II